MRLPALLALALILLSAAHAQERPRDPPAGAIPVHVGDAPLGPVPDRATDGFNYGNAMQVVGFDGAFDAIHVGSLRFPPGNQADEIEIARADLEALAMNLDLLGGPPVLMVANLFGGTPAQAADLARATADLDIPVLAWEIGNEPDLYASNRNAPSWTPARWCERAREFIAALRAVDPGARIAGPGVSGSRPGGEDYLREVLLRCGDALDVLTWHVYPTDGTWGDEAALATAATVTDEIRRYRAWARDPETNPLGHERDMAFGITEFGLSWRSASFTHLEDTTAALWLADVLGRMTAARLDMSHYFTLQGMGGHGLIAVGGWIRPTYRVFELLATFTGDAVPVLVAPPLRGYAVRDADGHEILLINPSDRGLRARVHLPERDGPPFRIRTLADAGADAAPSIDRQVARRDRPVPLPPRAVVHLRAPAHP